MVSPRYLEVDGETWRKLERFSELPLLGDFESVERRSKMQRESGKGSCWGGRIFPIRLWQTKAASKIGKHLNMHSSYFFTQVITTNYKENCQINTLTWSMTLMEDLVSQKITYQNKIK